MSTLSPTPLAWRPPATVSRMHITMYRFPGRDNPTSSKRPSPSFLPCANHTLEKKKHGLLQSKPCMVSVDIDTSEPHPGFAQADSRNESSDTCVGTSALPVITVERIFCQASCRRCCSRGTSHSYEKSI